MPRGWRITKSAQAASAFDGEGARLHGGRWNSPGTSVVYTAQSEALAALELLVHLQSSQLLLAYCSIAADFDASLIEAVDPASLPGNWREYPAPAALQTIGDRWVAEQRSLVLQVPSAIVPSEVNYLLAPQHPDFRRVALSKPKPFTLDPRLK
jgi:RES domain-containing protein